MRNISRCIAIICLASILCGCSVWDYVMDPSYDRSSDFLPSVGVVESVFSIATLPTGEVAYLSDYQNEIVFVEKDQISEHSVKISRDQYFTEITSGEKYFYAYSCDDEEEIGILYIYDKSGEEVDEISLPFKRINVSDGIVYGYYDYMALFFYCDSNTSDNNIEATHYISEDKLLKKQSHDIKNWTKINGGNEVRINGKRLYLCSSDDFFHYVDYYSDKKPLSVLPQIEYVRYCDGRFSSDEDDSIIASRMDQIYGMMQEKEENFVIHAFEVEDRIFGTCNVYKQSGSLLTFNTEDLKYSFSFGYEERDDRLYKKNEYDDTELVYEDGDNCLYHKMDGVYYKNLKSDEEEKVFDYDGRIDVTVLSGLVRCQESKIYYGDDEEEVTEKITIKQLW